MRGDVSAVLERLAAVDRKAHRNVVRNRCFEYLVENLGEDEELEWMREAVYVPDPERPGALHNGVLALTSWRLVFNGEKGSTTGSWSYRELRSVGRAGQIVDASTQSGQVLKFVLGFDKSTDELSQMLSAFINAGLQEAESAAKPAPNPPVAAAATTAAQLAQLAELHSAGAITDEEFSLAKAQLLG